jgi:hypothetical protein
MLGQTAYRGSGLAQRRFLSLRFRRDRSGRGAGLELEVLFLYDALCERSGSAAMKARKCLSLRETADTIRRVSAPVAT